MHNIPLISSPTIHEQLLHFLNRLQRTYASRFSADVACMSGLNKTPRPDSATTTSFLAIEYRAQRSKNKVTKRLHSIRPIVAHCELQYRHTNARRCKMR
jgi:hypothetical protein